MREFLRSVSLFAELDEKELSAVQGLVTTSELPKNKIIVQEGEPGDALFIILDGSVKVSSYMPDGREIVLSLMSKGAFFGEMSLLDKSPRSATVTTMETTTLAQIRRRDFEPLLTQQPGITRKLLNEVASRLRRTSRALERVSSLDVPHRLYAYLVDHCHRFGISDNNGWYATVLPTHQLLADQLSSSRETISRAISALKKEGILEAAQGRGKVRVDMRALETLLDACM